MAQPIDGQPLADSGTASPLAGLVRFLRIVRLRKGVLFGAVFFSGLLGALHYATATRIYESAAELVVMKTGGDPLEGASESSRSINDYMPTYRQLLESDAVLHAALKSLPVEHRGDLRGIPREKWIQTIRDTLNVTSARGTNIMRITYHSKDPQTAAVVVNAILVSYLKYMDQLNRNSAEKVLRVLSHEKEDLEIKLRDKEQELLGESRQLGVLFSDGVQTTNLATERAKSFNEAILAATNRRIDTQALLAAIEEAVKNRQSLEQYVLQVNDILGREVLSRELGMDSSGAFAIAQMHKQLVEDRSKLDSLLNIYGERNNKVRALAEKIQSTQKWLSDRPEAVRQESRKLQDVSLGPQLIQMTRQRLAQNIEEERSRASELEAAKTVALEMNNQLATVENLQLDVNRMRKYFDFLLEKMKTVDFQRDANFQSEVIGSPHVVPIPVSPKLRLVAFVSLLLGVSIGLAVISVLDLLDDRFRSADELKLQLGVPVLAMVRKMDPTGGAGIDAVHTYVRPNGVDTEPYRTLRTALSFSSAQGVQRVVVTSTDPGDGKTTTLVNLAVAFAQSGRRTLLIDADMRRPGLSTLLDKRGAAGLSQVLRDGDAISDAVLRSLSETGVEGLDCIPSGSRPVNPAELLASDRFSELLAWAETEYDQVLIDAPPALAVSDATIVGRLVDGVLLVVQPEKNRRKMVIRAVETFTSVGITVFGVVANQLSSESGADYYGYGYGYGEEYGHDNDVDETSASWPDEETDADDPHFGDAERHGQAIRPQNAA